MTTDRELFDQHKINADRRGIVFEIPFPDWVAWWRAALGPSWRSQRGAKKGQYCMARFNDQGPYSLANVKCILHADNVSEAAENGRFPDGSKSVRAKLTEAQALIIFHSQKKMLELASEFNVCLSAVNDIRSRRTWKRLLINETRRDLTGRNQWN